MMQTTTDLNSDGFPMSSFDSVLLLFSSFVLLLLAFAVLLDRVLMDFGESHPSSSTLEVSLARNRKYQLTKAFSCRYLQSNATDQLSVLLLHILKVR